MEHLKLALAIALLAPAALAQRAAVLPPESAVQPIQSPDAISPPVLGRGLDGGSGTFVPIVPDDSIPLPVAPVIRRGPGGDELVAPASGDPFFLSFAAGQYYPPQGERLDPLMLSRLQSFYDDGRSQQETYAFAMFSGRITPERVAELESLGARVLGFHPHYALKLALPPAAVDAVASLPYVRWVGMPRDSHRVHPSLEVMLAATPPGAWLEVYVNVFDSDLNASSTSQPIASVRSGGLGELDQPAEASNHVPSRTMSNGWQQRALERLGVEVGEYIDDLRAFRARMQPAAVELLVSSDFVQFVEPYLALRPLHDESMPMIQADFTRTQVNGGTSGSVVAGIVDTGFAVGSHNALGGLWFGIDFSGNPVFSAWNDLSGHGTHVAGTLLGNGSVSPAWKGVAPGLGGANNRRVIAARITNDAGFAPAGLTTAAIMAAMGQAWNDGSGNITPKPHVINNSWGSCFGTPDEPCNGATFPFWGSEVDARVVDNAVYTNDQVYVFAAGNDGPAARTVEVQASAKNALTVGSVVDYNSTAALDGAQAVGDPGNLWDRSSRGPCADGRWKPNVVAPGRQIFSAQAGTAAGYVNKSGTSMAAPHVTGLAAQLCDQYAYLQYQPARLEALLMATAMTKDDAGPSWPFDAGVGGHLNLYGAGRIEAHKALFVNSHWVWGSTGFIQASAGYTFTDFNVPAGATRLVVCLRYHEVGASPGGNPALINNLDLYLDDPSNGISAGGNTGDYWSLSNLDNTEILMVPNPSAGLWRFKATTTSFVNSVKASLAYCYVTGSTKPDGTLLLSAPSCAQPNQIVPITATVSNPSYVASAVFLETTVAGNPLIDTTTTLKDGAATYFPNVDPGPNVSNNHNGYDLLLGDITAGDTRSATWRARWATEGIVNWQVEARSDNWVKETQTVQIRIDGTGPDAVTNLTSTTHVPNVWSNNPNIGYSWTEAFDNLSGVDGYAILTAGAPALPNPIKVIEEVTAHSESLPTGIWFFSIRAVDNCVANWSPFHAATGPYLIDTIAPFGPSGLNSPSHQIGVQSCNSVATVQWTAASDADSGGAGYLGVWDGSPTTIPAGPPNIGALATSFTIDIGSSPAARYFHLRALDLAGNYGVTQHFGPLFADANSIREYCTAKVNSLGCTPAIAWTGQPSLSNPSLNVTCSSVINKKIGLLFWGRDEFAAPFQGGILCVKPPVTRTVPQNSNGSASGQDCSGHYAYGFTGAYMSTQGMIPGQTIYSQWWARDPNSPSTTSLSDALQFTVCE